jgi:Anti-sigma-K factor rskA
MNRPPAPRNPRIEELLMKRALYGLDEAEARELRALGGDDDVTFDLAVAAVAAAGIVEEPLPPALAAKVMEAATPKRTIVSPSVPRPARVAWLGWVAAAACLVLAAGVVVWAAQKPREVIVRVREPVPPTKAPAPRSPAQARDELLADAKDVSRIDWKATQDPAGRTEKGDIVWSPSAQRGYMRFTGLEPNDKSKTQYQLWIFDKDRDARYPVDGGVFDIPPGGEVVVPIAAKLHVDAAALFAVTVEEAGGVVVSARKRIVVTAAGAS